jgi:hypothetical protein
MKTDIHNEKGQALVFVVATMTVALAVGVGVSLRNLSSLSRISRTDTSSRAQAAAEGGAENVLSLTDNELEAKIGASPTVITYVPTGNDNVTAEAEVTVDYYNLSPDQDYLPLLVQKGQVVEIVLSGDPVEVCWSPLTEDLSTDLYFTSYNDSGDVARAGVSASSRAGFPGSYDSKFDGSDGGEDGFSDCYTPDVVSSVTGLRVRSINGISRLGVYPSGDLPDQGFTITSVGKLQNVEQGEEAEVSVVVVRSFARASGIFDFGVFSGSMGMPLD